MGIASDAHQYSCKYTKYNLNVVSGSIITP